MLLFHDAVFFSDTLQATVTVGGAVVDSTNQSVGIRNLAWDAQRGLMVNEQRVKMRGACNHESFTGVGAALPDRVVRRPHKVHYVATTLLKNFHCTY